MRGSRHTANAARIRSPHAGCGASAVGSSVSSRRGTLAIPTRMTSAITTAITTACDPTPTSSAASAGADPGSDHRAEAEEGVEHRQDRLPGVLLDRRRLDVHHDVEAAAAEADQHEADQHHGHRVQRLCADADQSHADGDHHPGQKHPAAAPGARQQRGSGRDADHRGQAHAHEHRAQLTVVDAEIVLDRRYARRPGRDRHPADEEDREDRGAPAQELGSGEGGVHDSTVPNRIRAVESIRSPCSLRCIVEA